MTPAQEKYIYKYNIYIYIYLTCTGLSLFYFASGNSDSRGDSCTLSLLLLPVRDLVALCCQRGTDRISHVPSSAIITACVDSVRGGCRGGVGGLWWWLALT